MKKTLFMLVIIATSISFTGCREETITYVVDDVTDMMQNIKERTNIVDILKNTYTNNDEQDVTLGQKNAVKSANAYVREMPLSVKGLSKQLTLDKYTQNEINYAVRNVKVDWNKQAYLAAEDYINDYESRNTQGISRKEVGMALENAGFTFSQVQYALNKTKQFGKKDVIKAITKLAKNSTSKSNLKEKLEAESYTPNEITYAMETIMIDWNEQAARLAKKYLKQKGYSKEGLADRLKLDGFSEEEINYALVDVGYGALTQNNTTSQATTNTKSTEENSDIIARVGDIAIDIALLDNELIQYDKTEQDMTHYYGKNYKNNPEIVEQYNTFKDEIVETLIEEEILFLKAQEIKFISVTEEEINDAIKEIKEDYDSEYELYMALQEKGFTLESLKKYVIKELYVSKLIDYYAKNKTFVSVAEINAYYYEYLDRFKTATMYHILLDTKEEAQEIVKQLKQGEDFGTLAMKYSLDTTKYEGGCLGEVTFDTTKYDKDLIDAIKKLDEGQISNPIETQYGWHIVKLENIETVPLKDARDEILEILQKVKVGQLLTKELEQWKQEYTIEYYKDNYYTS